jgi:hypothetical protein
MTDAPELLVEWSSPWQEFCSAIGPALRRSPPRLSLETRAGLFPFRGILVTVLLEIAALAAAMAPVNGVQPVALQTPRPTRDVIYFSADELPRTQDLAGAARGSHGQRGGAAIHHSTQVIKVARDEVLREKVTDAPQLNLPKSDSRLSNLLAYRADAGPAPAEALTLKRQAPLMPAAVVPPRPEILRSELRPMQLATPAVVPPPVELPHENISARLSLPLATAVIPPPVSAPVQATNRAAQLTLPREAVVAPPAEMSGVTRFRQRSAEFVPRVVPPPVELGAVRTTASAAALNEKQTVVPPPVELQNLRQNVRQVVGNTTAVPPTVDISSVRQQRTLAVASVAVIPPAASSSDTGRKYSGGAGEKTGPVSSGTGVVVSPRPGDKPGLPANSEKATLAMSPSGSFLGAGGDGGGSGVAHGSGSGNSPSGANSGAANSGAGKGASASNRTGNSPYPGPGGAGNLSNGTPRVPGVSVSGGNNVVRLPSFGGTPDPHAAGRSTVEKPSSNAVTVVASPRSGGATNLYGALKGDRVYTIYIKTAIGTAVMQFADPASAAHPYDTDLSAPQAIRVDLPSDLERSRLLIACVLDRNGVLKHWRVLQSDSHDFSTKVLSALPDWKFSPALRGEETVEVNAILGFGVDTK